jgi:hypothetical protein
VEFTATGAAPHAQGPPIDWPAWKAEVLVRLDIAREYESLGVEFTRTSANSKGIRECRAFGRQDREPSAFVNLKTGVYHDSGGGGETMDLLEFALRHGGGRWGRWIDVARHYGEKAGVPLGHVAFSSKGRILEAVYGYHDPEGRLVFGVHRLRLPNGDKDFRQYPWRDGRWLKAEGCMEGVPLYPYRLPELLAAPADDPVWIVEGEKDVERARSLGLVATCNPMGGGKWRDDFSAYLRGRHCYVIPDNDPTGRSHAIRVAASLRGIAAGVKVVTLPDLALHGDLSEWLDAGATVEDLGRLAYAAREWEPPAEGAAPDPDPDLTRDATVADLRGLQSAESWICPLWIPSAALTLVAAEAGTGKTRFCFDLARRVYRDLGWPDGSAIGAVAGGKTLWVVADNQWQEMCDVAAAFGVPDEAVVLNATAADPYAGTSLQTGEELADLEARIRRVRPALVVIDTVTNTTDLKAQDVSDAKRQYKPLQEIANRCQVAILCVTHLNAGGKVLGRRATEKVRVVIQLSCPDPDGQPNRRKLWVEKSKAVKPPPLGVTMGDLGNEYDDMPPVAPEPAVGRIGGARTGPIPARTLAAMDWLARRLAVGRARVSQLRRESEAEGISTGTLYNAKDALRIVEEVDEDNKKWWLLPEVPDAPGGRNGQTPS